ncbi:hypothetical protein HN51_004836 [Arachis hypogaea]
MLPIICFRDGSPPLPDALSMTNSAISVQKNIRMTLTNHQEGKEYAKENGLSFLETSAKTAQNVNELFYEIAKRLAKANPSHQTRTKLHSIPQETKRRSLFCCV